MSPSLAEEAANRMFESGSGLIKTLAIIISHLYYTYPHCHLGDGNRVLKTEGGETILYINQYYEKNLTTGEVTTYYYLGGRRVAMRTGTDLTYTHQDHLTGTALVTSDNGTQLGIISYYPYGNG